MKLDDPDYVAAQYRDAANFDARVRIYELYDVSDERLPRWMFRRMRLREGERVLEVGCGTGNLWRDNAERIPAGLALTLTDLSAGMLSRRVRASPGSRPPRVPDRRRAESSLRRRELRRGRSEPHALPMPPTRRRCPSSGACCGPVGDCSTTYPWTHLLEIREALERLGLVGMMQPLRRGPTSSISSSGPRDRARLPDRAGRAPRQLARGDRHSAADGLRALGPGRTRSRRDARATARPRRAPDRAHRCVPDPDRGRHDLRVARLGICRLQTQKRLPSGSSGT